MCVTAGRLQLSTRRLQYQTCSLLCTSIAHLIQTPHRCMCVFVCACLTVCACLPACHMQVYVDQPTVAQTVSILRGLRERYELHHGVRISDSALVEAAVLSDRYLADR